MCLIAFRIIIIQKGIKKFAIIKTASFQQLRVEGFQKVHNHCNEVNIAFCLQISSLNLNCLFKMNSMVVRFTSVFLSHHYYIGGGRNRNKLTETIMKLNEKHSMALYIHHHSSSRFFLFLRMTVFPKLTHCFQLFGFWLGFFKI